MNDIYALIDEHTEYLMTLTEEERLAYFRRALHSEPLDFSHESGETLYLVRAHFDNNAGESVQEKLRRLTL